VTSFSQRDNKPYEANIQLADGTAARVQFDKLVITAGGDSGQVHYKKYRVAAINQEF
jgi:hypothetical protein